MAGCRFAVPPVLPDKIYNDKAENRRSPYTMAGVEEELKEIARRHHRFYAKRIGITGPLERVEEAVTDLRRCFRYYEEIGDRAAQHQVCVAVLFNRNKCRWAGKQDAARLYTALLNEM